MFESDSACQAATRALPRWVDPHPIYLSVNSKTPRLLPDAARSDYRIVVVVSDASHAIVDSEAALRVGIARMRSLVDEDAHGGHAASFAKMLRIKASHARSFGDNPEQHAS